MFGTPASCAGRDPFEKLRGWSCWTPLTARGVLGSSAGPLVAGVSRGSDLCIRLHTSARGISVGFIGVE